MAAQHIRGGVVGGLGIMVFAVNMATPARIVDSLLFAAVAGGAALVPDWDSRTSTITKALPIITVPIHWLIKWIHRAVYHATRRDLDPTSKTANGWRSVHRGITHTFPSAVLISAVLAAVLYAAGWMASAVLIFLLVMLAGDIVFAPLLLVGWTLITLWQYGVAGTILHLWGMSWFWALAVFIGWCAHILGDCPTTAGVPIFAPFTWKKLVLPITFKAGGPFERYVVKFALIGTIVYLLVMLNLSNLTTTLDAVVREAARVGNLAG